MKATFPNVIFCRHEGTEAAKELIFTARRVSAQQALELGMVGKVVATGRAESEALLLAGRIAERGPVAVRSAKEAIDTGMEASSLVDVVGVGVGDSGDFWAIFTVPCQTEKLDFKKEFAFISVT